MSQNIPPNPSDLPPQVQGGGFSPYQPGSVPPQLSSSGYSRYEDVPWYRRSGVNSAFVITHLLTCGLIPALIFVCIVLVTGDVYYDKKDASGKLKVWSVLNKIVAAIILLLNILFIARALFASPA